MVGLSQRCRISFQASHQCIPIGSTNGYFSSRKWITIESNILNHHKFSRGHEKAMSDIQKTNSLLDCVESRDHLSEEQVNISQEKANCDASH